MVDIIQNINETYDDFNTSGVPASGDKTPVKAEIRALLKQFAGVDTDLAVAITAAGENVIVVNTLASVGDLSLAYVAGTLAFALGGAAAGVYLKVGSSGSGSWSLTDLVLTSQFVADYTAELAALDAAKLNISATTAYTRTLLDDPDAATARDTLGAASTTSVSSLADAVWAAIEGLDEQKFNVSSTTVFTRSLLDDPDAATARTTLGAASATSVASLADEVWGAIEELGTAKLNISATTAYTRTLLDDVDAAAARTTLGVTSSADLTASLNLKANKSTSITASGLATGGGDLYGDRTITVTAASQAEAEAGSATNVVMTPQRDKQAFESRTTAFTRNLLDDADAATARDTLGAASAADLATNAANIASEITRATAAEGAISDDLDAEISRASTAEGVITANLASEIARATAAEDEIAGDLADEITRATTAEGTITTNLASEVSRATSAEGVLDDKIDTKASESIDRDDALEAGLATTNTNLNARAQASLIALSFVSSSGTNIVASIPSAFSGVTIIAGTVIKFTTANNNTGNITITIGGVTYPLRDESNGELDAGAIKASRRYFAEYNTSGDNHFQLITNGLRYAELLERTVLNARAQSGIVDLVVGSSTANAIAATLPTSFSGVSLAQDMMVSFSPDYGNTGATTLMGLPLNNADGTALRLGDLRPNRNYTAVYYSASGGSFRLMTSPLSLTDARSEIGVTEIGIRAQLASLLSDDYTMSGRLPAGGGIYAQDTFQRWAVGVQVSTASVAGDFDVGDHLVALEQYHNFDTTAATAEYQTYLRDLTQVAASVAPLHASDVLIASGTIDLDAEGYPRETQTQVITPLPNIDQTVSRGIIARENMAIYQVWVTKTSGATTVVGYGMRAGIGFTGITQLRKGWFDIGSGFSAVSAAGANAVGMRVVKKVSSKRKNKQMRIGGKSAYNTTITSDGMTFTAIIPLVGEFDRVSPELCHASLVDVPIAGMKVAAVPSLSTLPSAATFTRCTFDGATSAVLRASSSASRRAYLKSDPVALSSVANTDTPGGPSLVMIMVHVASAVTAVTLGANTGTPYDMSAWTAHPSRPKRFRQQSGNVYSLPSNFTSTTDEDSTLISGAWYRPKGDVRTVAYVGDSIAQGVVGPYINSGHVDRACDLLKTTNTRFEPCSMAWSGQTYTEVVQQFDDLISGGVIPDFLVFPNYSPNSLSKPITTANIAAHRAQFKYMLDTCRTLGIEPIVWTGLPVNPAVHDYGASDSYRFDYNNEVGAYVDVQVVRFDRLVSDGLDGDGQELFDTAYTADGIHPNGTCYDLAAPMIEGGMLATGKIKRYTTVEP